MVALLVHHYKRKHESNGGGTFTKHNTIYIYIYICLRDVMFPYTFSPPLSHHCDHLSESRKVRDWEGVYVFQSANRHDKEQVFVLR